jgi:anti-sigma factor RsiW
MMYERMKSPVSVRLSPHGVGIENAEGCAAPERRDLLLPYAFGSCTSEQESSFEVHLLDCDRCFEDFRALERTRSLIERFMISEPPLLRRVRAQRRRRRVFCVLGAVFVLAVAVVGGYALGLAG